jgi:LPS O-antigen subunit length determinant protein (WzzB/FepE family)
MDIFEFMAIALESKKLQTYMSTIKYKGTTKSLLDKLLEAVQGILKAINPDIKSGTLAETALVNVLDFIKAEQEIKEQNAIFETADFDVSELENNLVERDLSEEQIYNGNVDLSEETPEDAEDTLMPVEDTTLPCEGGIAI